MQVYLCQQFLMEFSLKNTIEGKNPTRIAMQYFHTDLCAVGNGA